MKTNRTSRRNMIFESMEKRELFTSDLGFHPSVQAPETQPAVLMPVDLMVDGYEESRDASDGKKWQDTKLMGWDNTTHKKCNDEGITSEAPDYFIADSFSFGVEREMKESGEKGGTEDINIGVGELQECTISKSMEAAIAKLAQFAINGDSPGTAGIDFVKVAGGVDAAVVDTALAEFVSESQSIGDLENQASEAETANSGELTLRREIEQTSSYGGSRATYLRYELKNVQVTSLDVNASGNGVSPPVMTIANNFEE